MSTIPSKNGNGVTRFQKGNPGGPGNPFLAKMVACRKAFFDWTKPELLVERYAALDRALVKGLTKLVDEENPLKVGEFCALMRECRETLREIGDRAMGKPTPVEPAHDESDERGEIETFLDIIKNPEIHDRIVGELLAARGRQNGGAK
ncbi:MAG TPA: hypothetical protein VJP77_05680 [Planctomycetota bacterium]|nr:hypothetical protein [Planctomycetota bacterium]